mmetsp:Transcript_40674/g.112974  ORF Transcript_40674/g.112974 Transcript_40674/m.112974 type:complete len:212 (+) Transcript_40674:721-1356(+)
MRAIVKSHHVCVTGNADHVHVAAVCPRCSQSVGDLFAVVDMATPAITTRVLFTDPWLPQHQHQKLVRACIGNLCQQPVHLLVAHDAAVGHTLRPRVDHHEADAAHTEGVVCGQGVSGDLWAWHALVEGGARRAGRGRVRAPVVAAEVVVVPDVRHGGAAEEPPLVLRPVHDGKGVQIELRVVDLDVMVVHVPHVQKEIVLGIRDLAKNPVV